MENKEKLPKKFVVGGLVQHKGKFVFVREGSGEIAGKVNLPLGGLEKGETLEHGAQREMEEETGLKVRLLRKIGVYHTTRANDQEVEKHIYHAESVGGTMKPEEGIAELLHLSLDEFEKIPDSEHREPVNRMIAQDFRAHRWHKEGEIREY